MLWGSGRLLATATLGAAVPRTCSQPTPCSSFRVQTAPLASRCPYAAETWRRPRTPAACDHRHCWRHTGRLQLRQLLQAACVLFQAPRARLSRRPRQERLPPPSARPLRMLQPRTRTARHRQGHPCGQASYVPRNASRTHRRRACAARARALRGGRRTPRVSNAWVPPSPSLTSPVHTRPAPASTCACACA